MQPVTVTTAMLSAGPPSPSLESSPFPSTVDSPSTDYSPSPSPDNNSSSPSADDSPSPSTEGAPGPSPESSPPPTPEDSGPSPSPDDYSPSPLPGAPTCATERLSCVQTAGLCNLCATTTCSAAAHPCRRSCTTVVDWPALDPPVPRRHDTTHSPTSAPASTPYTRRRIVLRTAAEAPCSRCCALGNSNAGTCVYRIFTTVHPAGQSAVEGGKHCN
jgi:hypothetical protein